jgi:DNA-binding PadR family transcriptional regulator
LVSERNLAPGEWAVLALLCERPAHGWALARQLAPTGELGSIWSLTRPLVYRSLEILEERGLIVPAGHEPGARGPNRTIFRATPAGHAALAEWLSEPVEHVREGRSLLLLKLVFAQRNCVDPRPLLLAQQRALATTIGSLEERVGESAGIEAILLRFRLESSRAVDRFIDGVFAELEPAGRPSEPRPLAGNGATAPTSSAGPHAANDGDGVRAR